MTLTLNMNITNFWSVILLIRWNVTKDICETLGNIR